MKNKVNNVRKGFTLVELLIVIVVIGILSAMMMMSSQEAVSSARANNICSNMRNLQTATLAYWADNMERFSTNSYTWNETTDFKEVVKYLKDDQQISEVGYSVVQPETGGGLFVKYDFSDAGLASDNRVKTKIKGRAKQLGLLSSNGDSNRSSYYDATQNVMFLAVR